MLNNLTRLKLEVERFLQLRSQLGAIHHVEETDAYGFTLRRRGSSDRAQIDFLVTALIHGDEVGGIEALNLFLERFLRAENGPDLQIGFLLGNYEAAFQGVRFVERDLNRSFLVEKTAELELRRVEEMLPMLQRARCLIDLHQTVEPTEQPFFVLEENLDLVRWAHALDPQMPIVTFPSMGFSHSGKTVLEYVTSRGGRGVAVEIGARGFSQPLAMRVEGFLNRALASLTAKPDSLPNEKAGASIETYYLTNFILNKDGARLRPGLINFMQIQKGDVLGSDHHGEILAPESGRLFFPKYGKLADSSPEICEIGVLKKVAKTDGVE